MSGRKRCHEPWPGECPPGTGAVNLGHHCARPPGHAPGHMCYCGAKRPSGDDDQAAEQLDQAQLW